jgi:hypothetical protein
MGHKMLDIPVEAVSSFEFPRAITEVSRPHLAIRVGRYIPHVHDVHDVD